jgi:hypothetical protein
MPTVERDAVCGIGGDIDELAADDLAIPTADFALHVLALFTALGTVFVRLEGTCLTIPVFVELGLDLVVFADGH